MPSNDHDVQPVRNAGTLVPIGSMATPKSEAELRIAENLSTLQTLWTGYEMGELRFITDKETRVGYFKDRKAAAAHAYVAELEGYACYCLLNPVDEYKVSWTNNFNETGRGRAATDQSILRRQWLLIDADPVRPAGFCSCSEEHEMAREAIKEVKEYLGSIGWPDPIVADSGNGYHLLYRIDLPADDNSLVYRALHSIHNLFSSESIKFDTTVGNAARICRFYGTLNAKGINTPERPHRRSRILETPNPIEIVPIELITQLSNTAPAALNLKSPIARSTITHQAEAVQSIIDESKINQARTKLRSLPIAVQGKEGSKRCFRAACVLTREFKLSVEQAYPLLKEYSDRCEPPWSEKELLHKLESAVQAENKSLTNKGDSLVGGSAAGGQREKKSTGKRRSTADKLLALAREHCELWRNDIDDQAFATMKVPSRGPQGPVGGAITSSWHYENHLIRSQSFSDFLRVIYLESAGKVATRQALSSAVDAAAALAVYRGTAETVYTRVARLEDKIYLDLCDELWQAVEITTSGWSVVARPSCKFRRANGMRSLPTPVRGGSLAQFQELFNVEEKDLKLLIAWLVMTLHGTGPFPILTIFGEQGSAKSTVASLIRGLIDPNRAKARSVPREERDLFITAENSYIIGFDNLSRIDHDLSDLLCRISTGAGHSTRKLYTDCEEQIFEVCRPIAMTSIAEVVTRLDLLDRSLVIELPVITGPKRRTEKLMRANYRKYRPQLLGLLLDGAVEALRNHESVETKTKQRMADFEQWAAASMPAFGWTPADFMDAYAKNIEAAVGVALEGSPVVPAIKTLLKAQGGSWPKAGTTQGCQNLLRDLELLPEGAHYKDMRGWPSKYHLLATILRELAPALRRSGINITFHERETGGDRVTPIVIESI